MDNELFHRRLDAFAERLKKFSNPWALVGTVVVAVIVAILNSMRDSVVTQRVGDPGSRAVSRFLVRLIDAPSGWFLAALVLGILGWLVIAYIETSPAVQAWSAKSKRPTAIERNQLRAELETVRSQLRISEWCSQFDDLPPTVEALSEIDRREADTELSRYKGDLVDISRTMGLLLEDFTRCVHYDLGAIAAGLFWKYEKKPMMYLLSLAMDPGEEDRRVVFRAFLERYRNFKKTLREMSKSQGRDLAAFPGYDVWHAADAAFSVSLGKLADIDGTKATRQFIRDQDIRVLMPAPATSWEASGVEHIPMTNAVSPKIHPAPGPFPERRTG